MIREIFAAVCISTLSLAQTYPPLNVRVDDVETQLYVQYPWWISEVSTNAGQNTVSMDFNNRAYLSTVDSIDPSAYFKPNLLGGSMEYDADLSQVGCGCVSALYTVLMPGIDNSSDPFKYCDASKVGGHYCPEFDIMEANKYAYHVTGHKCDAPQNGIYNNCDSWGSCTVDIHENSDPSDYGPGSSYTINTQRPFHVKTEFHESEGQFVGYTTTLTQDESSSVVMSTGNCNYLKHMTSDVTQMIIAISNWGSNSLDWMEHGSCSGSCSQTNTYQSYSNLSFTSASPNPNPNPEPEPSPEPSPVPDVWKTWKTLEEIRAQPHYSTTSHSRTLYQVDRELAFLEAKFVQLFEAASENHIL